MCHHGHCFARDRILWVRWPISMGVRPGKVLPNGTASVLQADITPYPVLTQLLFTYYQNSVISKKSLHAPRSIGDLEGLLGRLEGGRLVISEPKWCSCRLKRWVSSGAKVGNRAAGQVKDGPGTGCVYSQQAGLGQKREGTHKSDELVSKITCSSWEGVPMVILPMYSIYMEKERVG